jgi:hypothetical protein
MDWKDIASKVASAAPAIGAALAPATGGVSALAGTAIGVLAKVLGVEENPQAVNDVLESAAGNSQAMAEIRLKLKIADNEFLLKQRDQDIEELRLRLTDVQSARRRQVEHEKTTGQVDKFFYVLATWSVASPVALLAFLIYHGLPKMVPEVALLIGGFIGVIIGEYKTVMSYFFGSSAGSTAKSATIAAMTEKKG